MLEATCSASPKPSMRPPLLELCDELLRKDTQAPCFEAVIALAVYDGGWHYWAADLTRTQCKAGFVKALPSKSNVVIFLGAEEAATLFATGKLPSEPKGFWCAGDRALLARFVERYFQGGSWLNLQSAKRPTRPSLKSLRTSKEPA